MGATDITEPQRQPSEERKATNKAKAVPAMEATDITEAQGKGNNQRNARHQGKDVAPMGATDIAEPQGQGRCDSLVVIPFPLLRLLALSLSESSGTTKARAKAFASMDITKARAFASMGATDIAEPTTATIGATATIPQLLSGKRSGKARALRFP